MWCDCAGGEDEEEEYLGEEGDGDEDDQDPEEGGTLNDVSFSF